MRTRAAPAIVRAKYLVKVLLKRNFELWISIFYLRRIMHDKLPLLLSSVAVVISLASHFRAPCMVDVDTGTPGGSELPDPPLLTIELQELCAARCR